MFSKRKIRTCTKLCVLCLVLHTTKVVTLYQLSKEFDEFLECSLTWKYVPYWYKKHIYLHQDMAILDNFVSRYHKTRRGITFSYLIDILVCLVYRLQMYLYLWKRCFMYLYLWKRCSSLMFSHNLIHFVFRIIIILYLKSNLMKYFTKRTWNNFQFCITVVPS